MRYLLVCCVLAGCSHKSAPTTDWCTSYQNELRERASADVRAMTLDPANRRHGAEELLAMVGSDPAIKIALDVCTDADGDTPELIEARGTRVIDLQHEISQYILSHPGDAPLADAEAKALQQLVDQLANTYTDPAPVKP